MGLGSRTPFMTTPITASATALVKPSATDVWQVMRRFDDLSWTRGAVEEILIEGAGVGMIRRVRTAGSDEWIAERLVELDDDRMTFSYVIEGDGMPDIDNYRATATTTPTEEGTEIRWDLAATTDATHKAASTQLLEAMSSGMVHLFAAQFNTSGSLADEGN